MMSLFKTIVIGLDVGAIACLPMPGAEKMGSIRTFLPGIAGASLAGFFGQPLGGYAAGQPASWIAWVVGAPLLLFVVGKARRGGPSS